MSDPNLVFRIAAPSLLLSLLILIPVTVSAGEESFVAEGVATDVRVDGSKWRSENGVLIGSGEGNLLIAGKQIGSGDFTARVRLAIDQLGKSAASLVINGSHFGFEGKAGEMFTEGAVFGRRDLGAPVVAEGRAFNLEARREGDTLAIEIDGKPVTTGKLKSTERVDIGLRPHRSTMRIARFTVQGELLDRPEPLPHVDIFRSGAGAYHTYRIPAIVMTRKGSLLAFCEGRKSGRGDAGNIDLLVTRSTDGGKTWSEPLVVWDDGGNTCGNPCPVVDQETGVIWLPMTWNLGSDHERDIMAKKSKHPRHVYITHSKDDGLSWAPPKKISDTTRKPHWRWYATGPGNAIQLTRGPHKGRLLIPANHSDHSDPDLHPYRSHVFWSDDHGESWQLGGVHQDRTNESAVVERANGSILQAMRSYHGKNRRAMAVSQDGGKTWGEVHLAEALDTPVCQASILRYSWHDQRLGSAPPRSRILFSSPRGGGRSHLTVWLSYDEGETWPISREVHAGGSAYSNLIVLPEGRIGVLYEKDGYKTISLVFLPLSWLEGG